MFATCYRTLLNELLGLDIPPMSPDPEGTDYAYSPGRIEDMNAEEGRYFRSTPVEFMEEEEEEEEEEKST